MNTSKLRLKVYYRSHTIELDYSKQDRVWVASSQRYGYPLLCSSRNKEECIKDIKEAIDEMRVKGD